MLFLPLALDVVQEDLSGTFPKVGLARGLHGPAAAQLSADNVCFRQVPEVVTHRPPGALVENLHAAGTAPVAACQPQGGPASWGRKGVSGCWPLPLPVEDWTALCHPGSLFFPWLCTHTLHAAMRVPCQRAALRRLMASIFKKARHRILTCICRKWTPTR